MKKLLLSALAIGALTFSSCSDDDDTALPANSNLVIDIDGLEALGDEFVYEGWIIVNGTPQTTGRFTTVTFPQTFSVDREALAAATKFVLTVEPANETGADLTAPSLQKLIAGDFSGNSAAVNISTAPAVGSGEANGFADSWGRFFLRTPTDEADGMNNGNDENGVWFGTPGTMPPGVGLGLATLPDGWVYEGWVVTDQGPISTGTFTSPDGSDNAAPFSSTLHGAPPIPGEDFFQDEGDIAPDGVTFPIDVRGKTVVISIEPSPDDAEAPFLLKPLVGTAGQETAPTTHDLTFSTDTFPTGTATR